MINIFLRLGLDVSWYTYVRMLYDCQFHEVKIQSQETSSELSTELGLCTYLDAIFGLACSVHPNLGNRHFMSQ